MGHPGPEDPSEYPWPGGVPVNQKEQRHPVEQHPQPEFPQQDQAHPGETEEMEPRPDHGEERDPAVAVADDVVDQPISLSRRSFERTRTKAMGC